MLRQKLVLSAHGAINPDARPINIAGIGITASTYVPVGGECYA